MASSSSTDLSLHQEEQAATGRSKRKQTPNSAATPPADTDEDDDEAFMESIKTELFCSLQRMKKKSMKISLLPDDFLAPLSPMSRPEQNEVVAPPRRDSREDNDDGNSSTPTSSRGIKLNKSKVGKQKRRRSQSKGKKNIRTGRTPQPLNTGEIINVDELVQKITVNVDPHNSSTTVLQRAKNLQSSLKPGLISFLKPIPLSSVSGDDIRLNLPVNFYKKHLPDEDATVILEDDNGDRYETKDSSSRGKLGLGWRKFCKAHKLVQGDVLVFQLINQTNFKVYIVRSNLSDEEMDAAKSVSAGAEKNLVTNDDNLVEFDSCDDLVSNSIESTTISAVDFKNVRSIEDFVIVIDGSVLNDDSNIKIKYYELCRSQSRYLHQNLVKGLNRKLAAGIITEVVNIADAIKAANSKMSREIISEWVKTLSGFKNMGMEVGFLLDWVQKLNEVEEKSEMAIKNARMKRDCAEKEKIELEAKLKVASEALDQYNGELKKLEKKRELMLHQVGNVPW